MYISDLDLIKARLAIEGKLNQSEIIKLILQDWSIDEKQRFMDVGERYYAGRHDILNHDFRQSIVYDKGTDENGEECEKSQTITNSNNSNIHNIHPFFRLLVDQKVGYVVGKPPTVSVEDDKAFETAITQITTDEDFPDMLDDWVKEASKKGIGWVHPYYDSDGSLQYIVVPAGEVIAFYDGEHQRTLEDVVRFYTFDVVSSGRTVKRYKVEWWTNHDVTYYVQDENGNYLLDPSYTRNPAPHWWDVTTVDGAETHREPHAWGRVPWVPLYNNAEAESDLGGQDDSGRPCGIKSLIDSYDMISSASTNDQIDLVALYWIVKGFGGETSREIVRRLQINKVVNIDGGGAGDGVSAQQVALSVDDRCKWLEMLRHDIYHFGMGIDTSDEQLGSNPSGVALKFKYTQLDLKANPLILKLKKALKSLFWFFTEDMNRRQGTQYDSSRIVVTVNKTMIVNDMESVQMITQSRGLVPDNILLAHHPLVDDAEQAEKDLEEQTARQDVRRSKLFGNNDVTSGGEAV